MDLLLGFLPSGAKLALLGALVAAAGLLYWHYTNVVNARDAALAQVGALQVENQVQDQTINTLEGAVDRWSEHAKMLQETNEAMAKAQREASAEQRRLNDVLAKHDLEYLSLRKPGLIERRINSGTADILGMFERATSGREDDGRGGAPAGEPASASGPAAD